MDHLDHPDEGTWRDRQLWFEEELDRAQGEYGGYEVSEQACALMAEVQAVFCAGAWVGVVILAMAVIDAQLRETEVPGFAGSAHELRREDLLPHPGQDQVLPAPG